MIEAGSPPVMPFLQLPPKEIGYPPTLEDALSEMFNLRPSRGSCLCVHGPFKTCGCKVDSLMKRALVTDTRRPAWGGYPGSPIAAQKL